MLREEDIAIELKCQQFTCKCYMRDLEETESVLLFESRQKTEEVECPHCKGKVYVDGYGQTSLKDMPVWYGMAQELTFLCHRYECTRCGKKFTEEVPLRHPGTKVTERAARWIQAMLRFKVSIRSIQKLTGIHWETIRNLHLEIMENTLEQHMAELRAGGYRPRFLAVDEFSIRKGHTYATCVMDLETGEVLWVGEGRSKEDFEVFFQETDADFLKDVMAVAMDMNASYHLLVKKHLPWAQIVYDRYHMQAQYGKDVLGVVRLFEARAHKERSKAVKETIADLHGEDRKRAKEEARMEQRQYSQIKKLRWTLLTKAESLSESRAAHLAEILDLHSDLAVCYAMKEEMCSLFDLRDSAAAEIGWKKWFAAAKESGIPALVKFAELKEKRIDGLIAHATYPISTGKIEGFNNKIKVAKRLAYGYRDNHFFFTLVRFLSVPLPK